MPQISLEELYSGEKYGGLNSVGAELLTGRCPGGYEWRTWSEMLTVKHTLLIAEKMKNEGDFVSGITDVKSLSNFTEVSCSPKTLEGSALKPRGSPSGMAALLLTG